MSSAQGKYHYRIVMSGDAIEAVIARIDQSVADFWQAKPTKALFDATHPSDEMPAPEVPEGQQLPDWREFPDSIHLEGIEVHNGVIEVYDESGEIVHSDSIGSDEFWDAHVDVLDRYEPSNSFRGSLPAFVALTSYTGRYEYGLILTEEFDRDNLMVAVSQVEETTPFISRVWYDGKVVSGKGGTGRYLWQSSGIYSESEAPHVHISNFGLIGDYQST